MIFLLGVLLYILIGLLVVTKSLSYDDSRDEMERRARELSSSSNLSFEGSQRYIIFIAVVIWPIFIVGSIIDILKGDGKHD